VRSVQRSIDSADFNVGKDFKKRKPSHHQQQQQQQLKHKHINNSHQELLNSSKYIKE